jgi:hypothetical protein
LVLLEFVLMTVLSSARRCLAACLLLSIAACGTPPLKLAPTPLPAVDLSGHWVLDAGRSEDPAGKIKLVLGEQMAARIPGRMRGKAGGMMGGGGGAMGGGAMSEKMSAAREKIDDLAYRISGQISFPDRMTLAQHRDQLVLTVDAKAKTIPFGITADRGDGKFQSGWEGGTFVLAVQKDPDTRVVQRYVLQADRSLSVMTEITLKKLHDPITVQRVFVAVAPSS